MALPEREGMDFDVVVVGAGPAGLATAIRLKQISAEKGEEINVVVVEKGSEVGAHILSGAVIDPSGLDVLLPEWRQDPERPLKTEVQRDEFMVLTAASGLRLPNMFFPKFMSNHGNFVGSLSNLTKYLGAQAEALGVEIYPGFPASEVLYDENGAVIGIATGDLGISRSGEPRDDFTRGMELRGKYTVFGEGARGSLTKTLIDRFALNKDSDHQKYGLGIKELWQLAPDKFEPGLVQHTMGWPLPNKAGGGSWLYHFDEGLLSVGFVTHLNYENPTLSPFEEFQRFKTHPMIREVFEGAKRIGYGARAIMEGGWQSVPKLVFPGGCLVGDSAGFVNVPRIKGSHNAIQSGMQAAGLQRGCNGLGRLHPG
ncbi:NAD(P)/FAD-dependent oxidoreductase, partial [Methylobacterium gnaphalii]|uniref:NAD(P)/FAD-dependent oxidoreductase n=1 Tax=Methylobacterium gnaphalii TaxID=1010610 RepID=UPI001EE2FB92